MHELGIVFHVIRAVEDTAQKNDAAQVCSVTLELGEVSGVVHEELLSCWKWAVQKHPIMAGAALCLEPVPAVTFCQSCGKTYPTVPQGKLCPHCGSADTFLQQGSEITIKQIAVR